jgi:rhodanese-related sulfurtransferase
MNMNRSILYRWLSCSSLVFAAAALAVSPADLRQKLSAGEKLTLVDVRPTALFKQGHIPNAINLPAAVVPHKQLPPLGRVVVYDEGLGSDAASVAVAALNQKPGITAESLDGGFAAWETAQSPTTKPRGMTPEEFPRITYARLKRVPGENLVLVDLRETPHAVASAKAIAGTATPALTDLQAEFPSARITRSALETTGAKTANLAGVSAAKSSPLLVLIDSGNGAAQQMARTLKANGVKRFVILVGGEETLANKGRIGRSRISAVTKTTSAGINTNSNR